MIKKIVLGTVQLGLDYGINNQHGKPSLEQAFEILDVAFDNGINILDTAEAYGNSQEIIGKFQKEFPNKKFQIITKLASNAEIVPEKFIGHIAHNCKVLNSDQLLGYMFHNYPSFKSRESLYDKLLLAKKEGLVSKAGISLYGNNEIEDVLNNYDGFDFIQIPFNLFDNDSKRGALLKEAKRKGVEVHTRSVFLQGLFFKPISKISAKLNPLITHLDILESIKNSTSINTQTLALQYVLQKNSINHVLIGVETAKQLSDNVNNCKIEQIIPHHLIDAIDVKEIELLNPSNWS
jgi:aryl-alcohol dehydrogenase-like predicted oxidoreductase